MSKRLTKSQINKVERLGNEIFSLWKEININESTYSKKDLEKMDLALKNKETKLKNYCISVNISEEEFYSIEIISNILDGTEFNDYMTN